MAGQRIRDFKKIYSDDQVLNRVQDQVAQSISQLLRTEVLDGRLIKDVELSAGISNEVEHKLGRDLIGYIVTKKNAQSDIWDEQQNNARISSFLNLRSENNVTVDLWVF